MYCNNEMQFPDATCCRDAETITTVQIIMLITLGLLWVLCWWPFANIVRNNLLQKLSFCEERGRCKELLWENYFCKIEHTYLDKEDWTRVHFPPIVWKVNDCTFWLQYPCVDVGRLEAEAARAQNWSNCRGRQRRRRSWESRDTPNALSCDTSPWEAFHHFVLLLPLWQVSVGYVVTRIVWLEVLNLSRCWNGRLLGAFTGGK